MTQIVFAYTCVFACALGGSALTTAAPRMTVDHEGNVRLPNGSVFLAKGVNWGKRSMSSDGRTLYNSSDPSIGKKLLPGLNHVRLVLDYYDPSGVCQTDIFEAGSPSTGFIKPLWLKYIDDAVAWTGDAGLWITLTLRNNYGTASPHGQSTNAVPCEADYIGNSSAKQLWFSTLQFLARRYKNASNIAWFEPASEPHLTHGTAKTNFTPCHSVDEITNLFNEVIAAIRTVDTSTPIAMGGGATGYGACPGLSVADKLADDQVIYNMNWPCHLGKADNVTYGSQVSCSDLGKVITQCIPECKDANGTVKYDKKFVETLMQPTLSYQRVHKVPLWIDQLMCAPRAEHGSAQWLHDSFATLQSNIPNGFHFNWWTWKGDVADNPMSMSVLVYPTNRTKLDLQDYIIDEDVYTFYKSAFNSSGTYYV